MNPTRFPSRDSRSSGFSLVEMIGVLAIIAILAVVIVPKVFSTIASSRITNAVGSVTSMKSAVSEFAGKFGTVPTTGANSRIDDLLITAGLLDSRFTVKVGTQPGANPVTGAAWTRNAAGQWGAAGGSNQGGQSRIISLNSNQNNPSGANGANYCLNPGATLNLTTDSLPLNSRVVSAVIVGVTANDALELSRRIDGDNLSEADTSTADNRGKVVYAAGGATKVVYIYLAHQ